MKNLLPYFVLISSIFDGLFLGAVLIHLPPLVVMPIWYGSGAILCIALYLIKYRRDKMFHGFKNNWMKIIAFYFFSILSGVCWMFAVFYLGLGISTIMDQAHYVLIILWSILILKEHFSKHMAFATLFILTGVYIITHGAHQDQSWIGFIFIGLMSVGYAGTTIVKKSLSGNINHNTVIVTRALLMMAGACFAHLYLNNGSFVGYDFEPYLWLLLVIGGMIGAGLNHHLSLAALKFTSLSHYILIQMLEPMLMLLAGVLLYQDIITPTQFFGIGVVLIGKAILVKGKWDKKLNKH
ncbi:MAG: DMT family transporter [Pseudomonadota bacterium]